MKVLIVEDDKNLANALLYMLEKHGYEADMVHNGQDGLEYGKSDYYDVIVLDVMLPLMDGREVCKNLRRVKIDTPVIMLTAKDSVSSKIKGLESGADDYMTKPFEPLELIARIRAMTRRKGQVIFEKLDFLDIELNLSDHDLKCKDQSVHLNHKEFSIMELLMENPEQVVSKQSIIENVWADDSFVEDNNVEAHISFLRRKLKFLNSQAKIETLRKTGYRLINGSE